VGTPLKGQTVDVQPGQKIYHKRNADWMVRIEGKDYFAIKSHHVLGLQDDTMKPEIVPVHNHVLILPDEMKDITKAGVHLKKKPLAHAGTIVHPGNSGTQALDRVHFGPCDRTEIKLDKEYLIIHKNYIWGISEK
jgi:co-chaperonin GroES (HSP10)